MRKLQMWLSAIVFAAGFGGVVSTVALPATSLAASSCDHYFLTMPPWYKGLTNADCTIMDPTKAQGGLSGFIWTIVLNVIEALLNLVAYITVGFIIYGGFKYMTSAGASDGIAKAKTTILNAVIGLVLSIMAIAIVNVIAGAF